MGQWSKWTGCLELRTNFCMLRIIFVVLWSTQILMEIIHGFPQRFDRSCLLSYSDKVSSRSWPSFPHPNSIPFVLAALWDEAAISDNAGNQRCWRHIKGWVPWQVMLAVTHHSQGSWDASVAKFTNLWPPSQASRHQSQGQPLGGWHPPLSMSKALHRAAPEKEIPVQTAWLIFGLSVVGFLWSPPNHLEIGLESSEWGERILDHVRTM